MLSACAETNGYALMGGGHTATLVSQRGMSDKMGHVSTGGGACLDYIAGRTLPAFMPRTECTAVSTGNYTCSSRRIRSHRETRTPDLLITNQTLYQLSHSGADRGHERVVIIPPIQTLGS